METLIVIRTSATKSFSWGVDTVTSVRFNPAELDVSYITSLQLLHRSLQVLEQTGVLHCMTYVVLQFYER